MKKMIWKKLISKIKQGKVIWAKLREELEDVSKVWHKALCKTKEKLNSVKTLTRNTKKWKIAKSFDDAMRRSWI